MLNPLNISADCVEENSPEFSKMMRSLHGPLAVDNFLRQAVGTCWGMLREEKSTLEMLEQQVRRRVDRVLTEFKDDAKTFAFVKGE